MTAEQIAHTDGRLFLTAYRLRARLEGGKPVKYLMRETKILKGDGVWENLPTPELPPRGIAAAFDADSVAPARFDPGLHDRILITCPTRGRIRADECAGCKYHDELHYLHGIRSPCIYTSLGFKRARQALKSIAANSLEHPIDLGSGWEIGLYRDLTILRRGPHVFTWNGRFDEFDAKDWINFIGWAVRWARAREPELAGELAGKLNQLRVRRR